MAKTIGMAQAKWERKTAGAGERWKRNTNGAAQRYAQGETEFLGAPVSGSVVQAWEQGVGAVGADEFQRSISGKGGKWAENYRRSMTGG